MQIKYNNNEKSDAYSIGLTMAAASEVGRSNGLRCFKSAHSALAMIKGW